MEKTIVPWAISEFKFIFRLKIFPETDPLDLPEMTFQIIYLTV